MVPTLSSAHQLTMLSTVTVFTFTAVADPLNFKHTTQIKVMQLTLLTNCQQYKVIYSRKSGLKLQTIFP